MKWNRYQSFCHFRKEKIVEYDVEIGSFTLVVSRTEKLNKWHYGVMLGTTYITQNSPYDTPKQAKEAAIVALREFLKDTIDLLPPEKEKK